MFGEQRLAHAFSRANGGTSAEIIDSVDTELARFVTDAEQHDDLTVLAIRSTA